MVDDPVMANDHRNIALIGATDGVPYFKDKHRGCWPFVFRVANLPDSLSLLTTNCHVSLFAGRDYLGHDPESKAVTTYVREPKSLHPHLMIICDDLYAAYTNGHVITDFSVPTELNSSTFRCNAVLLFWTADYPGMGYSRGMVDSGRHCCQWCNFDTGPMDKSIFRCVVGQFRYRPANHHFRVDPSFGKTEIREPPGIRTHAEVVREGERNTEYSGSQNGENAPWKASGCKHVSPLTYLPGMDVVWDMGPDMMHIVEGALQRHILALLKGDRVPAKPNRERMKKDMTDSEWRRIKMAWKKVRDDHATWKLSNKDQRKLDTRSKWLGGEPGWIRSGLAVCRRTGSFKAHDWLKIAEGSWRYLFHDLFPDDPDNRKEDAVFALLSCIQDLLKAYSHDDRDDQLNQVSTMSHTDMAQLKVKTAENLSIYEKGIPRTELSPIFHIILHLPDAIYRWGCVRNFWCFWGERYNSQHVLHSSVLHICPTLTCCTYMSDTSSFSFVEHVCWSSNISVPNYLHVVHICTTLLLHVSDISVGHICSACRTYLSNV